MITQKVVCGLENGLHARPAALIAHEAKELRTRIIVTNKANGKSADARSVVALLTLAAKQGNELEVASDGENEADAAKRICAMLAGDI